MTSLEKLLTKYGMKEPTESMVEAGFEPTPLTIKNFERFRKSLNAIERGDQTGAASVATGPIKEALDTELDNLAGVLKEAGHPASVTEPLKQARKTTRTLKTEFAPQDIAEKLVASKKNGGAAQITEASHVYDRLMGAGSKVEDARRVVRLLQKSDEGKQALGALQSTVIMDLIDSGFTTKSRKVAGENLFNPVAFKNRLAKINKNGKLDTIFSNSPEVLKKLKNIDKIASDLIPPSDAVPKGSAAVIMDLLNNLAVSKIPGGAMVLGMLQKAAEPVKTGVAVKEAIKASPDVIQLQNMVMERLPSLAAAIGIASQPGEQQ
jgi:hypothetical protein